MFSQFFGVRLRTSDLFLQFRGFQEISTSKKVISPVPISSIFGRWFSVSSLCWNTPSLIPSILDLCMTHMIVISDIVLSQSFFTNWVAKSMLTVLEREILRYTTASSLSVVSSQSMLLRMFSGRNPRPCISILADFATRTTFLSSAHSQQSIYVFSALTHSCLSSSAFSLYCFFADSQRAVSAVCDRGECILTSLGSFLCSSSCMLIPCRIQYMRAFTAVAQSCS